MGVRKPTVKCALLAAMIAKHRWGSPIVEEDLLSIAAIEPGEGQRIEIEILDGDQARDTRVNAGGWGS